MRWSIRAHCPGASTSLAATRPGSTQIIVLYLLFVVDEGRRSNIFFLAVGRWGQFYGTCYAGGQLLLLSMKETMLNAPRSFGASTDQAPGLSSVSV